MGWFVLFFLDSVALEPTSFPARERKRKVEANKNWVYGGPKKKGGER